MGIRDDNANNIHLHVPFPNHLACPLVVRLENFEDEICELLVVEHPVYVIPRVPRTQ